MSWSCAAPVKSNSEDRFCTAEVETTAAGNFDQEHSQQKFQSTSVREAREKMPSSLFHMSLCGLIHKTIIMV